MKARADLPAGSAEEALSAGENEGSEDSAQLLSLEDAEATRRRHLVGVFVFLGELFKRRVVQGVSCSHPPLPRRRR